MGGVQWCCSKELGKVKKGKTQGGKKPLELAGCGPENGFAVGSLIRPEARLNSWEMGSTKMGDMRSGCKEWQKSIHTGILGSGGHDTRLETIARLGKSS